VKNVILIANPAFLPSQNASQTKLQNSRKMLDLIPP